MPYITVIPKITKMGVALVIFKMDNRRKTIPCGAYPQQHKLFVADMSKVYNYNKNYAEYHRIA